MSLTPVHSPIIDIIIGLLIGGLFIAFVVWGVNQTVVTAKRWKQLALRYPGSPGALPATSRFVRRMYLGSRAHPFQGVRVYRDDIAVHFQSRSFRNHLRPIVIPHDAYRTEPLSSALDSAFTTLIPSNPECCRILLYTSDWQNL